MPRIVVVDSDHDSFQPELDLADELSVDLTIALSSSTEELVRNAAGADGILMQYATISSEVLDALPGLKAVSRYGVGVDTIDIDAATARGVAVCNVPDYGTEAVSDHAIALALSLARAIPRFDRGVRRGSADISPARPLHEIAGRTFGVVGVGAIGRATARKALGLGYRVLGTDVVTPAALPEGVRMVGLDELLGASDVVSLHIPLNAGNTHLIGAEELRRMRPGAVLVNTSRGGVVDTAALVVALRENLISGAGLDVFEDEPLPTSHPLTVLENVVLTPHAAWYTEESYRRLKERTLRHAVDVCAGMAPRGILNPSVMEARMRKARSG